MDYYRRKQMAMGMADKLATTGTLTLTDISFEVLKKTAISERFTEKYITTLIDKGFYQVQGEVILPANPRGDLNAVPKG